MLQGHYSDAEALLNKACFLDPCFKALSFMSEEQKESMVAATQGEVQYLASSQEPSEPPMKKQEEKNGLISLLADALKPPTEGVATVIADDKAKKWWLENGKYLQGCHRSTFVFLPH